MSSTNLIHCVPRTLAMALMGALTLLGCASGPKTFEIKGEADPVINRDISGKPLSVVVHLYQLKDAGEFTKLTFDMLASGRPVAELLGRDLLEKNEVMLVPGATHVGTDKINNDTKHIGIVAFFRQPDPHYWRLLVDASQVRNNGLSFRVRDCYLSLSHPKPTIIPGQPDNMVPACPGGDSRSAASAAGAGAPSARSGIAQPVNKRSVLHEAAKQVEPALMKRP